MHLIRHSLEFVSWKDRKTVMPALRAIYRAKDAEAGMKALEEFEAGVWGQRYPAIAQSWRRNWQHVTPLFAYPESVRRIIYTTDEMDKPFLRSPAIFPPARATSWRRAEPRLQALPGRRHSSLADLRRPRTTSLGGVGFHPLTKCS